MEVRLDGRTAIITGSSKGLGLAMAKEFAASGANVAILARSPEALAEAQATASDGASGKVATFSCDVSKAEDINKTFAAVIKTFGQADILINNAGMSRAMPSDQITDDIWQEDLDLKLFAAIRLARLCWPGMKERKWGRIINVLNTGAKAPRANGAPTAVSRAAGMALMKVMSAEGAPHGILVNGMLVGLIDSDQHVRRHAREGANVSYDEFRTKMGANVPIGRIGKVFFGSKNTDVRFDLIVIGRKLFIRDRPVVAHAIR